MDFSAPWTFHIVTLGCKINQYESQAIREAWTTLGGIEVRLEDNPQVFLVNSCAITARGERDTRHALYRVHRQLKEHTACLRIVTGCAAPLIGNNWTEEEQKKYFDALIPPRAKAVLMKHPRTLVGGERFSSDALLAQAHPFGKEGFAISAFKRARPVLKVQDGCSHGCTYCIVPLVRGKSISRPAMDVVQEAQRLLEAGHSEIMLSGINLHQYGRDLSAENNAQVTDFWDLLLLLEKHLAGEWHGKARLRISSLEPSQLTVRGVQALTSSSLLCPHIHLSLQHGAASVLKRMGRGHYKLQALHESVSLLRKAWPLMGLGADILMGFAGEREEDVQATLQCIEDLGLTYAHVFPYSIRPGTAAEKFPQQVPHAEKLERAARVRAKVQSQQEAFVQTLAGQERLALVLDGGSDKDMQSPHSTQWFKGVEAHYASCKISLPASHSEGIVMAKPVRVEGDSIVCAPISPIAPII